MSEIYQFLSILFLIIFIIPTHFACDLNNYEKQKKDMINDQIMSRGVKNKNIIQAMNQVPRHEFVPGKYKAFAYGDYPLSIGKGQTISQPYIVAFMTDVLDLTQEDKVLEIGTGSGYQAAVLAELVSQVYTIEIIPELGKDARETLKKLGYQNVHVKIGDGYQGWPEAAPFDAIIVTCAPEDIPQTLIEQLKEGGRMVIPVGTEGNVQTLFLVSKKDGEIMKQAEMDVRFVPMVKKKN